MTISQSPPAVNDPWAAIAVSQRRDEFTLRRMDPQHPLDFFRGRDAAGQYLLVLQTRQARGPLNTSPVFAGMDVAIRPGMDSGAELVLTLHSTNDLDVFRSLCGDLLEATSASPRDHDADAIPVVLARLHHWQEMLRRLSNSRLDHSRALGLFGELLLLRDLFLERLTPMDALRAWRGPSSDEQDFLLGEWMIEVKTQLSTSDRKIRIASPEQLDSPAETLLLCHQTVTVMPVDDESAETLNSLVRRIAQTLRDADISAHDLFIAALTAVGYTAHEEYEAFRWALNERHWYHVRKGFPRLVASSIPPGVENVQYSIRIDSCSGFRVDDSQTVNWVFHVKHEH